MRQAALFALATMLSACGGPASEAESGAADEFASRIGSGSSSAEGAGQQVDAGAQAPFSGTDVKQLEQLGDISSIDLGPRAGGGGCTFNADGQAMLTAAAPAERAIPGKATVRVDGQLIVLDAPPGGFDLVRMGTTFNGEGFSVLITPGGEGGDVMTITDAGGGQKNYNGRWVCT